MLAAAEVIDEIPVTSAVNFEESNHNGRILAAPLLDKVWPHSLDQQDVHKVRTCREWHDRPVRSCSVLSWRRFCAPLIPFRFCFHDYNIMDCVSGV